MDTIALQVALHCRNIMAKSEFNQRLAAYLCICIQISVAVLFTEAFCKDNNVLPVITVFREFEIFVFWIQLEITGFEGNAELFHLISSIVNEEFTAYFRPGKRQDIGKAVAQYASACITHVHWAGRIGGNELHHDFLPGQGTGAGKVPALTFCSGKDITVPFLTEAEVDKSSAGNLYRIKEAAGQYNSLDDQLSDFPGRHTQFFCCGHGKG